MSSGEGKRKIDWPRYVVVLIVVVSGIAIGPLFTQLSLHPTFWSNTLIVLGLVAWSLTILWITKDWWSRR